MSWIYNAVNDVLKWLGLKDEFDKTSYALLDSSSKITGTSIPGMQTWHDNLYKEEHFQVDNPNITGDSSAKAVLDEHEPRSEYGSAVSSGPTYGDNVSSDLFDVNEYFNEALNLARAEQEFNAKEANTARSYNALEAEKARNFSALEADKARSFNAQQALEQREFEERMANSQYQRAVQDMTAAGLNPYLIYAQGGNAVPSGAVASGPAAATSMASGMASQSTNFSSTYLNNITKLTTQMMALTGNIAGSAMKLLGALL